MEKHINILTVPVCTLSTRYEVFARQMFPTLLAYVE